MTRKDYYRVAAVICVAREQYPETLSHMRRVVEGVAIRMARSLAEDNPHFDREKFLSACGIEE